MTNAEILATVKKGLGITTTYQDDTLTVYINDVIAFMTSAGVPSDVVTSEAAVGCILRGVTDLWTYSSGAAKFSKVFEMRVIQLARG